MSYKEKGLKYLWQRKKSDIWIYDQIYLQSYFTLKGSTHSDVLHIIQFFFNSKEKYKEEDGNHMDAFKLDKIIITISFISFLSFLCLCVCMPTAQCFSTNLRPFIYILYILR